MTMPKYGLNNAKPEDWDRAAKNAKAVETKAIYAQMAEEEQREDLVNSPRHYTSGSIETIDAIKAASIYGEKVRRVTRVRRTY